jgi:hypothetical protein
LGFYPVLEQINPLDGLMSNLQLLISLPAFPAVIQPPAGAEVLFYSPKTKGNS